MNSKFERRLQNLSNLEKKVLTEIARMNDLGLAPNMVALAGMCGSTPAGIKPALMNLHKFGFITAGLKPPDDLAGFGPRPGDLDELLGKLRKH